MSSPNLNIPILDDFLLGEVISQHDGVRCYPAIRRGTEEKYIVKVVSIPSSPTKLEALLLTGALSGKEAALEYFRTLSQDVVAQADILHQLSHQEGFVPYMDSHIAPMEGEVGYEVYLLGTYKQALERILGSEVMTYADVINMGLDLCAALAASRRAGYLYVDLKPGNIFLDPEQGFRIGDVGFIGLSSLQYASLPDKYRSSYTAPELADDFAVLNPTVDIYALGLVLYQAFNGGILPFGGIAPDEILPPPVYADYEMAQIILKACHPDPRQRWQDPTQIAQALIGYMQVYGAPEEPIVPPVVEIPEPESEGETEEFLPEMDPEQLQLELEALEDAEQAELAFLQSLVSDETAPVEETAAALAEDMLTPELSEILAQADAVIAEPTSEAPEFTAPSMAEEPDAPEFIIPPIVTEPEEPNFVAPAMVANEEADAEEPVFIVPPIVFASEKPASPENESAMPQVAEEPAANEDVVEDMAVIEELVVEDVAATEEPIASEAVIEDAPVVEETVASEPVLPVEEEMPQPECPVEIPAEEPEAEASLPEPEEPEAVAAPEEMQPAAVPSESPVPQQDTVRFRFPWKIAVAALLILALFGLYSCGSYYYKNHYLVHVEDLILHNTEDKLTVQVVCDADESLLTVVCTDIYGNAVPSPVVDGIATFTGLHFSTRYTVRLEISGVHKLTGDISDSFVTPTQTQILSFIAGTGPEDCSVALSFITEGPDNENWIVYYGADGVETKSQAFTGHNVVITDLQLGALYTFTLQSTDGLYVTGQTQVTCLASNILCARELTITACGGGSLTVQWQQPDNGTVEQWSLRCFDGSGYDTTVITSDLSYTFTGMDHSTACTVEVTAVGMDRTVNTSITAHPVTVSDFSCVLTEDNALRVSWQSAYEAPEGGWILHYSINGGSQTILALEEPTAELIALPDATYQFTIKAADSSFVFGAEQSYTVTEIADFTNYGFLPSELTVTTFLWPQGEDWLWSDIPVENMTAAFAYGEQMGFQLHVTTLPEEATNPVRITYVLFDAEELPVGTESTEMVWNDMWQDGYCCLQAPVLPEETGSYTWCVYFDGCFVFMQEFTVV